MWRLILPVSIRCSPQLLNFLLDKAPLAQLGVLEINLHHQGATHAKRAQVLTMTVFDAHIPHFGIQFN